MGIKFAEIPRDLLIMGCLVGEGGEGEIKNTAIIWPPPLTKYSVIHPRHWGLLSCHNDRERPPPHICDTLSLSLSQVFWEIFGHLLSGSVRSKQPSLGRS